MGLTEQVPLDEWRRAMDINLYGVLLPCRAVIPHFKQNSGLVAAEVTRLKLKKRQSSSRRLLQRNEFPAARLYFERWRRNESVAEYQLLRRVEGRRGSPHGNFGPRN